MFLYLLVTGLGNKDFCFLSILLCLSEPATSYHSQYSIDKSSSVCLCNLKRLLQLRFLYGKSLFLYLYKQSTSDTTHFANKLGLLLLKFYMTTFFFYFIIATSVQAFLPWCAIGRFEDNFG